MFNNLPRWWKCSIAHGIHIYNICRNQKNLNKVIYNTTLNRQLLTQTDIFPLILRKRLTELKYTIKLINLKVQNKILKQLELLISYLDTFDHHLSEFPSPCTYRSLANFEKDSTMVYALFCKVNFVVGSDYYHTFMWGGLGPHIYTTGKGDQGKRKLYEILNNNKLVEMM